MINLDKKIIFVLAVLLVTLFFRDTPYLNILVVNKVWLAYILIFLFLFPPKKARNLIYITVALLLVSLVLTLLNINNLAEFFGIVIYFLLWVTFIVKVASLKK